MKKSTILNIVCSLLVLLFTYTAISKLASHLLFYDVITKFPLLDVNASFFSWFIPLSELSVVALLFIPALKRYGFYSAAILLASFTIFLSLMIAFDKNLPCSCGGVIALLSWKQHIVFNIAFLLVALAGLYLDKQIKTDIRNNR